jgi:hypothetical protein
MIPRSARHRQKLLGLVVVIMIVVMVVIVVVRRGWVVIVMAVGAACQHKGRHAGEQESSNRLGSNHFLQSPYTSQMAS